MDEHGSDFFFSLLGFSLFIPIFVFSEIREISLKSRHIVAIWIVVTGIHLTSNYYYQSNNMYANLVNSITLCKEDLKSINDEL